MFKILICLIIGMSIAVGVKFLGYKIRKNSKKRFMQMKKERYYKEVKK